MAALCIFFAHLTLNTQANSSNVVQAMQGRWDEPLKTQEIHSEMV